MLIAKINNPIPIDYRDAFPNTSFPLSGPSDEFLASEGYTKVNAFKDHDRATQKLVSCDPYYEAPWVYTVKVEAKTAEELATEAEATQNKLIASVTQSVQQRLDDFAKTRNYDGILSACTYATSTVPKFQSEGQYAVNARDVTWAKLYEVMAEVESGTRPVLSGYSDIEPELPVLEWPV